DTSWLTYQNGILTLGPGTYDELLILDRAATEDEILAWYEAQSPFYDSSSIIQGTHIADGVITTEKIVAGAITTDKLAAGSITTDKLAAQAIRVTPSVGSGPPRIIADDGTKDRVVFGDVSGLPWGRNDTPLPSGSYGLWGDLAGVFLRGFPNIIKAFSVSINYFPFGSTDEGEVHTLIDQTFDLSSLVDTV